MRWELRILLLLFPLANRLFRLPTLTRLFRPGRPLNAPPLDRPERLMQLINRRLRNSRTRKDRNCLRRTFLAYRYLNAFRYAPEIHIGLKGDNREIGHCWIVLNGAPLCEDRDVESEFPNHIARDGDLVYRI